MAENFMLAWFLICYCFVFLWCVSTMKQWPLIKLEAHWANFSFCFSKSVKKISAKTTINCIESYFIPCFFPFINNGLPLYSTSPSQQPAPIHKHTATTLVVPRHQVWKEVNYLPFLWVPLCSKISRLPLSLTHTVSSSLSCIYLFFVSTGYLWEIKTISLGEGVRAGWGGLQRAKHRPGLSQTGRAGKRTFITITHINFITTHHISSTFPHSLAYFSSLFYLGSYPFNIGLILCIRPHIFYLFWPLLRRVMSTKSLSSWVKTSLLIETIVFLTEQERSHQRITDNKPLCHTVILFYSVKPRQQHNNTVSDKQCIEQFKLV